MKRNLILGVMMAVLLICSTAWAQTFVNSSGSQTASKLIYTGDGNLHKIVVSTDGTNAVTLDAYDETSATGTKLIPTWIVTSSSTDRTQTIGFSPPVRYSKGLYINVSVAGGGTTAYVVYTSR